MVAAAIAGAAIVGAGASAYSANKQSSAADKAAAQQAKSGEIAIDEQRRQYDLTRSDYSPFLQTGTSANQQLGYLMGLNQPSQSQMINVTPQFSSDSSNNSMTQGLPASQSNQLQIQPFGDMQSSPIYGSDAQAGGFGSLSKPFTMADYQADPGYAFRLSEGQKALDRTNAAKGKYFSGQAIKGLTDYNQDSASQEYQNAYNRFNTNQTNLYNRLAGLSGTGQTSANTLATTGQNTAANIGNLQTGIGNAQAAGQIGSANAWSTGLNNVGNNAMQAAGSYAQYKTAQGA